MTNEELYEKALEAIRELWSDHSVSVAEARCNLNALISDIELMIEAMTGEEEP